LYHAAEFNRRQGNNGVAEILYRRAFATYLPSYQAPPDEKSELPHLRARRHDYIGRLYLAVPSTDTGGLAEQHLQSALSLYESVYGPASFQSSEAMRLYGLIILKRGLTKNSVGWLEAALAAKKHALGANHHDVATALESLALGLHQDGRKSQALIKEAEARRIRGLIINAPSR
ncbi:MAG: hypothetical protein AAB425_00800, partial [Bdellovibrionota bacterium]